MIFQTIGFVGLIFGKDGGSHATVWKILVYVGFGVGLPAGCVYFVLRALDKHR